MRIGYFSPLPPAPTGVADYAAALLRALREIGSVRVNDSHADVCLYHVGNNELHREIYDRALSHPGIVVLHDAVLHHYLLGALTCEQYVAEFVHNYGAWHENTARTLWRNRARSGADETYFRYPMLRRLAEASLAVIVHNPEAAEIVRAHARDATIAEIPHLFVPPPLPATYEVERLRERLGLRGTTFLFGVFGHLRDSKRIAAILRAFERVRGACNAALLVAGEFTSPELQRALAPQLSRPGILRTGYLPDREFWLYASAVDGCINLRHPSAGETSGIGIRLMGIGKPVIVSEGPQNSRFPPAACVRIPGGVSEEQALAQCMVWLARSRDDAREIGWRAAEHIREHHAVARIAREYWRVLAAVRPAACYDLKSSGS